jgi:uridylate kinase
MKQETFVISVGGSIIVPGEINTVFLKKFIALVTKKVSQGARFVLVTGGGAVARDYNAALRTLARPAPADLDWLGISATRLNATLLIKAFGKLAHPSVITEFEKPVSSSKPIIIAGGWKPGRSSDYEAVLLAKWFNASTIINMSNIDYVYDKDPRKFKNAKKLTLIDWNSFQKLVGTKWVPGANVPFDPTATSFAKKHKQKVIILNGNNIVNLTAVLNGSGKFKGTVIV